MSRSSFIHVLALVVSLGAAGCSSDGSTPEQGSGGTSSNGGKTGSGGAASGGAVGNGGQTGEGGKPATGGNSGTGGSSASGGSANGGTSGMTGGSSGASAGGRVGTGGSANSGGAAAGGRASEGGGPGSGGSSTGGRASGGAGGQVGGSAGMASTGGGGGGGGGGYNPCKASPCVILPLGDSITHGFGSSDDAGYRSPLFKLIVAANQNVTFIGSRSNGPSNVSSKPFPKNHEGWDGISITGITGKVPPTQSFSTTPHIILVHIGTNDMTSNANPTTAASQLTTLLTNLVNAAPDALIVVAKIVPLGYNNSNYTSYIAKIGDVVKTFDGKHVVLLDMSTLPASDIKGNGDVHPTDKGYADMANLWYGAIKAYLPQ